MERKKLRLKDFDYSTRGLYFVTICCNSRLLLFGEVVDGMMRRNEAGNMIADLYYDTQRHFPDVQCMDMVVMPNHIHCIWFLRNDCNEPVRTSLIEIVHWFKSVTTTAYSVGVGRSNWIPYDRKLWQRSFYDEIISDSIHYETISKYIQNNPLNWVSDDYYKAC